MLSAELDLFIFGIYIADTVAGRPGVCRPRGEAAHGLLPARPEEGDTAGVGVLLLPGAQPSPAPTAALGVRMAVG